MKVFDYRLGHALVVQRCAMLVGIQGGIIRPNVHEANPFLQRRLGDCAEQF